jgi:hypothetical protein
MAVAFRRCGTGVRRFIRGPQTALPESAIPDNLAVGITK